MRERNPEQSPSRWVAWFAISAMAILMGVGLNTTMGACGGPSGAEPGAEGTTTETQTEVQQDIAAEKPADAGEEKKDTPDEPVSSPDEPATTKEDGPEPPPKEDTPEQTVTQGSGEVTGAKPASSNARSPLDASPSPDGKIIYYTAYKAAGDPTTGATRDPQDPTENQLGRHDGALFSVPATGGNTTELASGFWAPTGLVVSKDGSKIYVADAGLGSPAKVGEVGGIYVVPSSGGSKTLITGTAGYRPKSLDVVMETAEQLYFTGVDPTSGAPGVFRIPAAGGSVTTVFTPGAGEEFFKDPGGIAVTASGTIYVSETVGGAGGNESAIIQIKSGKATEFAMGIKVGYPAGLALSQDEKFLLVSGVDRNGGTAVLYRIDVADPKKIDLITKDIGQNTNSAGIHRAHNADIYAWADAKWPDENGQNGGTVYLLNTKANP